MCSAPGHEVGVRVDLVQELADLVPSAGLSEGATGPLQDSPDHAAHRAAVLKTHPGTSLTWTDTISTANLGTYPAQCLTRELGSSPGFSYSPERMGRSSVPSGFIDPRLVRVVVLAAVLLPSVQTAARSARWSSATRLRAPHLLNRVTDVQSSLSRHRRCLLRHMGPGQSGTSC